MMSRGARVQSFWDLLPRQLRDMADPSRSSRSCNSGAAGVCLPTRRLLGEETWAWEQQQEHGANLAWQTTPNYQNNEKNAARLTAKNQRKPHRKDRVKRGIEQREQWPLKCVSCEILPAASSLRQGAAASTCTTPGGAACSAPSSADSSPVQGSTFTHISPASLASAPPSSGSGRCGGCARCQTPADVCEHWRLCSMAQQKSRRWWALRHERAPHYSHGPTDERHRWHAERCESKHAKRHDASCSSVCNGWKPVVLWYILHQRTFLMRRCGKNMLDVCCDLTPYETSRQSFTCRHTVTMLLWSVARKCCSSQVSPCVV